MKAAIWGGGNIANTHAEALKAALKRLGTAVLGRRR